jgi:parvulin-like peptidyl-prolyl isomerase
MIPLFLASPCLAQGLSRAASVPSAQEASSVLARVNGVDIPSSRLDQRVRMTLNRLSRNPSGLTAEELQSLRSKTLDTLVQEEMLRQASVQAGIKIADPAVEQRLIAMQASFSTQEGYRRSLEEQGLTATDVRDQIRQNLAIETLIKSKVTDQVSVSKEEVAQYFEANRDKLRRAEAAHVQEIYVPLRGSAQEKAQTRQALETVLREARGGRDFSQLAREFSRGPNASTGGDIGWLTRNGGKPLLADAALKLRAGEVSDIIETPGGLHLLKVLEIKPASNVSLEEAQTQIEAKLREDKDQAALERYLSDLKAGARIEILAATP